METEKSLLEDILQGKRTAMRRLYERYSGYAMAVGLRYIADRDAVQDVLQDSFVKVFAAIDRFSYRGEGSLKAWVMRIVANESLNYLKQNQRLQFVDEMPDVADEDEDVDVKNIPMSVVMQMIQQLPAGYRTVFNQFVFEEKSHREIASDLGIKESTSASQYFRAKNLLAKMIQEYSKTTTI
ncbi:RNA polymerase sigma factor [Hoylesella buccalis]|uniref:RNA polymerase sigma factor SigW n=1 Tax=Hoylesella buccalis DNF00853 TaxID=1401074 RepID=A0A095ZM55_9BACT|nr:RNA polymerase sigma factor [Hoylesella buccalis]KGF35815.1 RNA polymerase sigma factor SigW [Hoylesella buccalis DNF00853]